MIRESLDANSKHSMFVGTSGNGVSFQNRTSSGGSSISITRNDLDAAPGWLKLNRNGNIFTAYYSEDGSSWISLGNQVINMSESVYIGLAVSSHNTESLCSTTFTDVSITQATLKSALNDDLLSQPEDFDITIYGKENNLVISTSSETLINSKLMVFDVMGRLIIETKLESLFNEYPIANKGIYIVKIHSPEALLKHEKVLIR